jgi:hypothetical protein
MPGKPIKIGPFVGGLNNISTAGESKDNEVVEMVNYEVGLDTALASRPPIEVVNGTALTLANQWDVLGIYRINTGNWYVIVNVPTGATTYDIKGFPLGDFTSISPLSIKTTTGLNNKVVSFVQYNDWCYFNVAVGATDTGFRYKIGSGAVSLAAMPRGNAMVSWEDRLWISATGDNTTGNYVYFSTVDGTGPHPETWNTSVDFFNTDPGSGGLNTALLPLTSALLIFKEDATYRFTFPTAPKNGDLSNISRQIGAAGPTSVCAFENYSFIYDQGKVYELINTKFTQLNRNVDFGKGVGDTVDALAPGVDMSIVSRRILIRYYNRMFAYGIDTQTWSEWTSVSGSPSKFIELPADSASANPSVYLAASRGSTQSVGVNQIDDPNFSDASKNIGRLTQANLNGSGVINASVATITKTGAGFPTLYLNETGGTADFDIPVSPGQRWTITATISSTTTVTDKARVIYTFLNRDGSTTQTISNITSLNVPNLSQPITIPANAILMNIQFGVSATASVGDVVTLTNPVFIRTNQSSPVSLMRLIDQYQNTTAVEYINCWVKTKAYDYSANTVFKRLFLWALDVKTPRAIEMQAIPLGKKTTVTWDDLEMYSWDQLEAGTWDNPLKWKNISTTVIDNTEGLIDISDNGRFVVKAEKSLRFRQIQYAVKMSTLGNADSGPAKLFSLTSYTRAGEMVVEKAT